MRESRLKGSGNALHQLKKRIFLDSHKTSAGFTLVEAILYMALFGLIMSGTLITAYQLIGSSGAISNKNTVQEEANFVLRKVAWAFSSASPATPSFSGYPSTVTINRYDGNTVDIRLLGSAIELRESLSGAGYQPLTTSNVSVTALQFHYIPATGGSPAGIEASTTINGVTFYTKRYIRN